MRFGLKGSCKLKTCARVDCFFNSLYAEIDAKELAERVMRGENTLRARRAVASVTDAQRQLNSDKRLPSSLEHW